MTEQEILTQIDHAERSGSTVLDLSGQRIKKLPAEMGRLTRVTELYLHDNLLEDLPGEIGRLTALKTLDLANNLLSRLPVETSALARLQNLNLRRNRLERLPANFGHLTELTTLDLGSNQMHGLPEEIGCLPKLATLYLANNALGRLPKNLARLSRLTTLVLNGTRLESLPEEITRLTHLTALHASNNALHSLPPEMSQLVRLRSLDLRFNHLQELPPELGLLTNLTSLDLRNNDLARLPAELGRLANLSELLVTRNPMVWPPAEIVSKGTKATLAFLRAQQSHGSIRLWRSKLVVVGEGGAGKTSLVNVLGGKEFDSQEHTTHGLRAHKPIDFAHPTEADVMMKLFAWDFGGQEIYHATHQFFLTDRALFLLVWNARLDYMLGRLEYWLDAIRARAPGSPIVIVATHLDERRAVPPPLKEWRKRHRIVGYHEVSNKSRQGIDNLKRGIAEVAAALPLMGQECPRLWIEAVDRGIQEIQKYHSDPENSRPYLPIRDLQSRLEAQGVPSDEIEFMLQWFHDLGGILYFAHDPELRNMVVLSPWQVSRDISKVLDHDNEMMDRGVLTAEEQKRVWPDLDDNIRSHLVRLMERFDLSYRVPETTTSLVVARLPADPPDLWEKRWADVERQGVCHELRLNYQLNTMPAGIPSWFIARSHRFSIGMGWRHGTLLADEGQKHLGLVRVQHRQPVIELIVRGPYPQNFFALLKDGLEVTLARYPGLECRRVIPCPCVKEGSCSHVFDYPQILRALERGKTQMECQQSFHPVSLARLLYGWSAGAQEALLGDIERHLNEGFARQKEAFAEHAALIQRHHLVLFKAFQGLDESHCPNVFLLKPTSQNGLAKWFAQKLELQLLCQAPGSWHSLGDEGRYMIHQPREWWTTVAPYLRTLAKVMRCAVPIAGDLMDSPVEKWTEPLAFMEALTRQIPDRSEVPLVDDGDRVQAAALRSLRKLLDELDPAQRWGGLAKVLTPEGHYLWLCPSHAARYR